LGAINSFEDILAWQKARELNKEIYQITQLDSFKNDIDFKRQIRLASVSISSNIAEGFDRNTDKEFVHFLFIAKASASEVRSQLYLALDLDYIDEKIFHDLTNKTLELSKLLAGFIKYLKNIK
jgi:four helix bundle protein